MPGDKNGFLEKGGCAKIRKRRIRFAGRGYQALPVSMSMDIDMNAKARSVIDHP